MTLPNHVQQPTAGPSATVTNGLSIAAFVIGILCGPGMILMFITGLNTDTESMRSASFAIGLGMMIGFIPMVLAIVFGHVGAAKARRERGSDLFGRIGMWCGYALLASPFLGMVVGAVLGRS